MFQYQWRWTGWSGGPGYTTVNMFDAPDTDPNVQAGKFDALFAGMTSLIPTGLSVRSTGVYRQLNATTGVLETEGSLSPLPANHAGSGNAAFASAVGMCIDWLTGVPDTHRLRSGRTFLVPLTSYIFATDGTISDSVVTSLSTLVNTVLTDLDGDLGVWKRPRGGAGGSLAPVTGFRVPDIGVILRSRRR